MIIDTNKLDENQKRRILEKLVGRLGLSQAAKQLGIARSTLYRYINGSQNIPLEVVEEASQKLSVEDITDAIYGTKVIEVDATTAISVIIKAVKDEKFRNFFLSLLYQNLGDYLKETSSVYIVTESDIKKFEKVLEDRSKSTKDMRLRYLRRALSSLGYELSPDGIRELILELREESTNIARHTANSLKLFIKTIVAEKNLPLAQTLYNSFRVPKSVYKYRPKPLSIGDLRKIFDHIEHLGAKAFFLMLAETGLRVGEVYSLKIDQVDLENRIIKIMKESRTKRAYISFLHRGSAEWIKKNYLPYREEFIKRYESAVRQIGVNVDEWKEKLFPFQLADLRASIKGAMVKVKEFRLYDLRSFFASYLIMNGVSPMIVNVLQGRAAPSQFQLLQNHYFVISEIELMKIYEEKAPKLLG